MICFLLKARRLWVRLAALSEMGKDMLGICPQYRVLCHLHFQHVSIADYCGKDIIEIMGDTSCKLAYCFHLLGLKKLGLKFFAIGNVPDNAGKI